MKLSKTTENKLRKEALRLLKNGKPDWDVPHTLCAVKWMKILISKESGDERILLPAIYFHDTGYPNLQKNYNFDELMASKKDHAQIGAENVKRILPDFGFSDEEIKQIAYLVKNHSIHNNINELDRQLVFEADGLAMLDWQEVKPNFDKNNCIRWLKEYYEKRKKYVKTKTGKKYLKILMAEAKLYLKNWPK